MPRFLRGIFRKRRELLLDLSQCAAEAIAEYVRGTLGADTRPGVVVSIATAGDLVQWHPHGHLLLADGVFSDDGRFHPLASWGGEAVMELFRERLLARLIERRAISEDLARKLLAWKHPGFSALRSPDRFRGQEGHRGRRLLPCEGPALAQEARLPRRREGRLVPLSHESPRSAETSRPWTPWSGWPV
jgi:hypothetical protein